MIDGPAPVVAGGTVFVNSGYALVGGMPGNVLPAFEVTAAESSSNEFATNYPARLRRTTERIHAGPNQYLLVTLDAPARRNKLWAP